MAQTNQSRPRVLVVDDEAPILRLLMGALDEAGVSVLTANSGEEALKLYVRHQNQIDLVLLDVQMLPWDGPRTLTELRQFDPNVRAAFMSGSPGEAPIEALFGLGALSVFPKPFPTLVGFLTSLCDLLEVECCEEQV